MSLSYSHGVFPLIYNVLKKYDDLIAFDKLKYMKQIYVDLVKENMFMTSELVKVMSLFEENHIEAISFKGPTLSKRAYGDISLRQYCDLDILLRKDDVYKVYDLLKDEYKRSLALSPSQESIWFKYAHDLGLVNEKGVNIEFHWSMFDSDHPINLGKIDFFKDIIKTDINNNKINTISNEKFLVYLCVHGSKHLYERVEWVCDIDKFIKNHDINWNKVDKLLKNDNSKRFFLLGLFLSKLLFDTKFDKKYEDEYDKDFEQVINHILNIWNKKIELNNKNNMKYMLKLFISNLDKSKYMHKIYLKPTFTEYWYITFPRPLYFLYYPLRQYLLIKKYLFEK